jgi:hypothetical protein
MARFCRYCGKQIEEEKICDCPESLENAARIVNRAENINKESKEVLNVFKAYFKDINMVTEKVINENNRSFVYVSGAAFLIAVLFNVFTAFNKLGNSINKIIKSSGTLFSLDYMEIMKYKLSSNIGKTILYSLLLGAVVMAVLIATIFILGKIKKSNWNNKNILYATIINTIPMTSVLMVFGLLQLVFSYKFILFAQVIYLIVLIATVSLLYNMITDGFQNLGDILIFSIVLFIAIVIIIVVYNKAILGIVGSYEINGQTLNSYIDYIKRNIISETSGMREDIIEEILGSFIY